MGVDGVGVDGVGVMVKEDKHEKVMVNDRVMEDVLGVERMC